METDWRKVGSGSGNRLREGLIYEKRLKALSFHGLSLDDIQRWVQVHMHLSDVSGKDAMVVFRP